MKINEYQQLAARTINPTLTPDEVRQHALHEMLSELGEIHDIFQKHLQGHPIDPAALKYEIGDLLWGMSELCTHYGWALEEIATMNIEKLRARYPRGFDADRSIHRPEYEGDVNHASD